MENLNLPAYSFRLRSQAGRRQIFDEIRKKWLVLTPEEWVRQHFAQYMIAHLGFPASLLQLEKEIMLHQQKKRVDMLFANHQGQPILLVECKAPEIKITQETFDQITRYNITLKVPYLVVTNGLNHYCALFDKASGNYQYLPEIPHFQDLH